MRMVVWLTGLVFHFTLRAQVPEIPAYPKGYFRNPLAVAMDLSGNFGELRPNHYHMGLDLKTLKKENLPVHAAAEGYVAKVKIEPGGFGRAIYITHPNGYTTLYAHLNDFAPALEAYVKREQYRLGEWRIFIDVPPDMFPVRKGELIAYSGNTGGSQAPHLHFEIRRTEDDVNLNPLLFGFPLSDNTSPRILRLAVFDRTRSTYEQTPRIIPVKAAGAATYTTTLPITVFSSSAISFGITAYDTHTGSSNLNGVFESILYMDQQLITSFRMDGISYNDTRYMNAHIDYKTKTAGGSYLQHLSDLPGYINSIYTRFNGDGVLDISDGEIHNIRIEVKDAYGNTSVLGTKVQYRRPPTVDRPPSSGKVFYPFMLDGFETEDCEFYLGERCLYDSAHIRYGKTNSANTQVVSAVHSIGSSYIPLQESFLVRLRPNQALTNEQQQKTLVQWFSGAKKDVQKAEWQNGWAAAKFRDFGFYQLLVDETPPVIVPIGFTDGSNLSKATRIAFTITDNFNKFKNVRAELDGSWLRFTNDKGRTFSYRFDEKCLNGLHELKISAEDEAGNKTVKLFRFTR
ncbi:MAG: M23 family metallopeptidase [Chitinophagaceae bacterium]|nr:M23 family metallopeptidase [Chitinophagaceae bacterium]